MKLFYIKIAGVLIAALILFTYQTQAHTLAVVNEALSGREEAVEEAADNAEEQGSSESTAQPTYKDGTYKGTGTGYSGDLTVEVTIDGGSIASIEIVDTADDKAYLALAEPITDDIVEKQTTEGVDTVSGATYSSKGILTAVEKALESAKNA